MSVWLIVVFAAVIAGLITALFFTVKGNMRLQKELEFSQRDVYAAEHELAGYRAELKDLERRLAYQDGLRDGRKTDTLYRQILKKCSGGEQFTVMMNGTKENNE